jgi:hypothetical protein
MIYRVDFLISGERSWAANSLTFDTPEVAEAYARNLSRPVDAGG